MRKGDEINLSECYIAAPVGSVGVHHVVHGTKSLCGRDATEWAAITCDIKEAMKSCFLCKGCETKAAALLSALGDGNG